MKRSPDDAPFRYDAECAHVAACLGSIDDCPEAMSFSIQPADDDPDILAVCIWFDFPLDAGGTVNLVACSVTERAMIRKVQDLAAVVRLVFDAAVRQARVAYDILQERDRTLKSLAKQIGL